MKLLWAVLKALIVYSTFGFHTLSWSAETWVKDAIRLTGESVEVRKQAIAHLRSIPNLSKLLSRELKGKYSPQALDVISTLKLSDLLPTLFQESKNDEKGTIYLAMNSLVNERNSTSIFSFYHQRLDCLPKCSTSPASQVVILDTFARTGEQVSLNEVAWLLRSLSPEVKSAALEYIRESVLRTSDPHFLPLIRQAMRSKPWQLRLQAFYLVSELPTWLRFLSGISIESCIFDRNREVRNNCSTLFGRK